MPSQAVSEGTVDRTVLADTSMQLGHVSLVRDRLIHPYDYSGLAQDHHLQLSLLRYPEHGRCCFPEAWGSKRFDPIGPLFLVPAAQIVHARSECPEQRSIVFSFRDQMLEKWFEDGIEWSVPQLERSLSIADPEIRRLMIGIGQELRNPGFATETLIELMASQIIVTLARQLWNVKESGPRGGLAPWRLRRIDDCLAHHPADCSLTRLAEECRLSVRQLSRAFRISRGCSIGAYIARSRIAYAQGRLAQGVPIAMVAKETGFSTTSNFTAAYRRVTGESPLESELLYFAH